MSSVCLNRNGSSLIRIRIRPLTLIRIRPFTLIRTTFDFDEVPDPDPDPHRNGANLKPLAYRPSTTLL
jgi:hypothetical protein